MSDSKSSVQQPQAYPTVFLQCRTMAFGAVSFFSFLWIIFLCVNVFLNWENVDRPQQSFMAVMLILHTLTIIVFIFLIVRVFRPWLDAARCFLGLLTHMGVAGAYTHWTPSFQCRQASTDKGLCSTRIIFTVASSWLIPTLLIVYSICLGILVYRLKKQQKMDTFEEDDLEKMMSHSLDLKVDWPAPPPSSAPDVKRISRPMTLSVAPSPRYDAVAHRQTLVPAIQPRQSLPATTNQVPPSLPPMDLRSSFSTYHSRHHSQPRQPSYSGVPEHLASTWNGQHMMQPHTRRPSYPSVTPTPYPYHMPIQPPSQFAKRKPPPLALNTSNHVAIQERNRHYSALFQQAPRTPVSMHATTPISVKPVEPVPPLPSPWGASKHQSKHQSQQYSPASQYSQTSLEYLKESPTPSPARLSKPSPASKVPSL
ncbi:hypothetical protein BKA70DRAFT_25623 [Coprinopsis sp. MPI-PUGE-AT-0042]|nr:hypothetical protein BKA70DRAFT_25623 [Coprinopsis sp. MPI-PUGE-AT-0042]